MVVPTAAFPPSFEGNPWTYGFALFSLTLICALAAAKLMHFLFEARARRAALRINHLYPPPPLPLANPLAIYRSIVSCFLLTILFGAFPDVLFLITWGEGSQELADNLLTLDRVGDGLTVIPFLTAIALTEWGAQVVPQQLVRRARVSLRPPRWRTFRQQLKIAGSVLVIAAGVTLAKAGAGG